MTSKLYKQNFSEIDFSKKIEFPSRKHVASEKRSDFAMPMIVSDYAAYECPVSGKMIEGRTAHSENLKRTGCRLSEKGEFEHIKKNGKEEANKRMDRAIDKAVDEIANTL